MKKEKAKGKVNWERFKRGQYLYEHKENHSFTQKDIDDLIYFYNNWDFEEDGKPTFTP